MEYKRVRCSATRQSHTPKVIQLIISRIFAAMTKTGKPTLAWAIGASSVVFISCMLVTLTPVFRAHSDRLVWPLLGDLLITAPVVYYLFIRKSGISNMTVLRVCMVGIVIASVLLAGTHTSALPFIKNWVSPIVELTFIGFVAWKFYRANRSVKKNNALPADFLSHCRAVLTSVTGAERVAGIFAAEIALFYYLLKGKDKRVDDIHVFSSYKKSGAVLVLSTILCLFLVETAAMHFIFLLWGKTTAWILTGLSIYTCLQLLAHIRALRARSTVMGDKYLHLRNGILGGDAVIELSNIQSVVATGKPTGNAGAVKLALIKGIEHHNLVIYLHQPVTIMKAFGIRKMATVIECTIDSPDTFIKRLTAAAD